jgi:hypothetical protein
MPNKRTILEARKARMSQPQQPNPIQVATLKKIASEATLNEANAELSLTKAFATLGPAALAGQVIPDMAPPAQPQLMPGMVPQGPPMAPPQSQPAPNPLAANPSPGT